jgi:hypothetical protein
MYTHLLKNKEKEIPHSVQHCRIFSCHRSSCNTASIFAKPFLLYIYTHTHTYIDCIIVTKHADKIQAWKNKLLWKLLYTEKVTKKLPINPKYNEALIPKLSAPTPITRLNTRNIVLTHWRYHAPCVRLDTRNSSDTLTTPSGDYFSSLQLGTGISAHRLQRS